MRKGITPKKAAEIRAKKGMRETKLQRIRVKKGLSQNDLSVISGVSMRRIQSYEQNKRAIEGARLDILCDLCLTLGVKLEDIIENKKTIEKFKKCK